MVNLNRHMDFRGALAGELLAAAARPPLPDAIRVVMMMTTPPGLGSPLDTLPPGFASPLMFATPSMPMPMRPPRYLDIEEGEVVDDEPRPSRRRAAPGHAARGRSGLRCLLPRPGVKRAVSFGEFKTQLSAQLAHPERLRDTHRLPCCVQLYRVTLDQPRADVARRLFGAGASATDLMMFTPDVARRLQLPPPRVARFDTGGSDSPFLSAGQEIVELRVIHDHTQGAPRDEEAPTPRERARASQRAPEPVGEAPRPPASAAATPPAAVMPRVEPAPVTPAAPAASAIRTEIPARFLTPDFKLTREEALFDMTVAASARGVLQAIRSVARTFARRGELERWRALLDGRERDEQLWQVQPPRAAFTDRRSRDWVRRALTLGGYDIEHMLREWELYWRRRGA